MPLIPAFGRQRQADLCEFEDSMAYKSSSRSSKATQRNPVSGKKKSVGKIKRGVFSGVSALSMYVLRCVSTDMI